MPTLCVVTIGQSPRVDVTPELATILGPQVDLIEHGALDDLDAEQIAALRPGPGAGEILTSRLRDGSHAVFTHAGVEPLLAQAVARGEEQGADATLIICSSHFPAFAHRQPLFCLEPLAHAALRGLTSGFTSVRLGVINPLPEQSAQQCGRWERTGARVRASAAASPYSDDPARIAQAAAAMASRCDLIVLDCAGYTAAMARDARQACRQAGHATAVVTVRSLGAHVLAAMF